MTVFTSHFARSKADEANSSSCEAILLMIQEAFKNGQYELILTNELLPINKRVYLKHLGFDVWEEGQNHYKISW